MGWLRGSGSHTTVGALVAPRHPQDDHEALVVVDRVDNPKVSNPQSPEFGAGEQRDSGRSRCEPQGEDRSAEPGCLARRQSPQLACGGRRKVDSVPPPGHSPGP